MRITSGHPIKEQDQENGVQDEKDDVNLFFFFI